MLATFFQVRMWECSRHSCSSTNDWTLMPHSSELSSSRSTSISDRSEARVMVKSWKWFIENSWRFRIKLHLFLVTYLGPHSLALPVLAHLTVSISDEGSLPEIALSDASISASTYFLFYRSVHVIYWEMVQYTPVTAPRSAWWSSPENDSRQGYTTQCQRKWTINNKHLNFIWPCGQYISLTLSKSMSVRYDFWHQTVVSQTHW